MPRLVLQPKPVHWLGSMLWLMHGGAIISLCSLSLPCWLILPGLVLCVVSGIYHSRQHWLLLAKKSIRHLSLLDTNQWLLQQRDSQQYLAILQGDSIVSASFILLNFKIIGKRRCQSVMLTQQSLPAEQFRQLQICLKTSR